MATTSSPPASSGVPRPGGPMNSALWILSVVLAGLFFIAGGAKFIGRMNQTFVGWGYTEGSAAMVGILEMVAAMGLLFVRTAGWAALTLMAIMVGAVWTLAVHQDYVTMIAPTLAFLSLAVIVWGRGLTWTTREAGGRELSNP